MANSQNPVDKAKQEPQAFEAEQSVLGAMLIDREAISRVIEILTDKSFYTDEHQKIYRTIVELYDKNIPIDLVILTEELKKKDELDAVGGASYLTTLLDRVVSSANVTHYAKIVKDKATLRDMIKSCNRIIESGYNGSSDVDEILDQAEQLIFNIKEKRVEKGFTHVKSVLKSSFELIEELSEKKKYITGIPSGFPDLDRLTAGFQTSDFIIVAGRPSMGKTAFCLNVAEYTGITQGLGVGIFSLEMAKEQVVMRMLCSQARVSSHKVRTGFVKKTDWPKLTTAAGLLSNAPIFIDDTPGIPILELRAKARRLKSMYDIKLLIVDYLQLVVGPRSDTRQQEISAISQSLKGLAKELNIPVIAVSQLSRAVEARVDRRPVLSDLRESGAIEQDADVVLFIYREERYRHTPENEGLAEITIGKQRNGPIGKIPLTFIKEYTRFESCAKGEVSMLDEEAVEG